MSANTEEWTVDTLKIHVEKELSRVLGKAWSPYCSINSLVGELEAKLIATPVPPVGGEVEVVVYACGPENQRQYVQPDNAFYDWYSQGAVPLVDRAHVTRLQAEVEHLTVKSASLEMVRHFCKMNQSAIEQAGHETIDGLAAERDQLQSKLAELQELLIEARNVVRSTAVLLPDSSFAPFKTKVDKVLLHLPSPAVDRIAGCADAAWLLYDRRLYGQHGLLVMDVATIFSKATSYAGYKAPEVFCKPCAGYGTVSTGITESPTTICDPCNGTGKVQP